MEPLVQDLDLLRGSGELKWTIPAEIIMKGIPHPVCLEGQVEYQEPIIDFVQMMEGPQKKIAMDHVKKLAGNNESIVMNECFRHAYNDNGRYYFPDSVINSSLSFKDFTTPFIIHVKEIHQKGGSGADALNELEQIKMKKRVEENVSRNKSVIAVQVKTEKVENVEEMRPEQQRKARKQSHHIVGPDLHAGTSGRTEATGKKVTSDPVIKPAMKPHNLVAKMRTARRPEISVASKANPQATASNYQLVKVTTTQQTPRSTPVAIRPKLPLPYSASSKLSVAKPGQTTNPTSSSSSQVKTVSPSRGLSPSVSIVYENLTSRPPSGTRALGKVSSGIELLGCKDCGKTYSMACESLFRSHVIIQHGKELTDEQILESTMRVHQFIKCRKCSVVLLNNLGIHQKRCCPDVSFQDAFSFSQVSPPGGMKLKCGLCSWAMDSRVCLVAHLKVEHPEVSHKVILHPYFRCAICLQVFPESSELIIHAGTCASTKSSLQTMLELAKKNMECEICGISHNKIRETLTCYQTRSLLRCILCFNVYKIRKNFFAHLQTCHGHGPSGLKCPFCDVGRMKVRDMFDHIVDTHYSEALRIEGEAAMEAGKLIFKANARQEALKRRTTASSVHVPAKMPNLQPQKNGVSTYRLSNKPPFLTTINFVPKVSASSTSTRSSPAPTKLPQTGIQVPIASVLQFSNPSARTGVPTYSVQSGSGIVQPCLVQLPQGLSLTPFKYTLIQPVQHPPRAETSLANAAKESTPKKIIKK